MATVTAARSFTPSLSSNSISGAAKAFPQADCTSSDSFPAGLRVLVVDDDPTCLLILDKMLQRCQYKVTTCGRAADALALLRENRDSYDVIISDVYMPDMDGFKLLELVGLEMDLPVIMMSANGETRAVMKGIKHGACDYLLKPVRMEELRNIWQHVVRKKFRSSTHVVVADDEKGRHANDDGDHHSSANEGSDGTWKHAKKRRDLKEDEEDTDLDPEDPSTTKKPRVVWSVELHQQFVNAVNQLGIDKVVPKRILELMNVHGLTRENVASHLQKYRLYLKRISGVAHQSGALSPSFPVSNDSSFGPAPAAGLGLGVVGDFRAVGGANELPSQALLAGVLERLNQANNLGIANIEKTNLLQLAALQGLENGNLNRAAFAATYGQPVLSDPALLQTGQCDINPVQLAQIGALPGIGLEKLPLGLSALQQQQLDSAVGLSGLGQLVGASNFQQGNPNRSALLVKALQQQQGGSHLLSKIGLAIAPNASVSHQGLSADAGVWPAAISNLNGNIRAQNSLPSQYAVTPRIGTIPSPCSGSSTQGLLARVSDTDQDCKVQQGLSTDAAVWGSSLSNLNASGSAGSVIAGQTNQLLEIGSSEPLGPGSLERAYDIENKCSLIPNHGNVSLMNPLSVPSSMTTSGPDSPLFSRIKQLNSVVLASNPATSQTVGPRFPAVPVMKQMSQASQRAQGTWPGFDLSQDFVQVSNTNNQSPGFSSGGSSTNQAFPLVSDQEQSDLCGLGLSAGIGKMYNADSTPLKSFPAEQPRNNSVLRARHEGLGWIPESMSDEVLNFFLQQQQEGLGLTE